MDVIGDRSKHTDLRGVHTSEVYLYTKVTTSGTPESVLIIKVTEESLF